MSISILTPHPHAHRPWQKASLLSNYSLKASLHSAQIALPSQNFWSWHSFLYPVSEAKRLTLYLFVESLSFSPDNELHGMCSLWVSLPIVSPEPGT